ncbi:MAG TPA: hypothetical protein VGF17_02385 [Phytomonospora sp.]
MAGIDDVKAGIAQAADSAGEGAALIQSAIDKHNEAIAQLRESTSGSGNPKVESSISRLEQVIQTLNEALSHNAGAMDDANDYAGML